MQTVCEWRDPVVGVVRIEQWPEGQVLWVGGQIISKSWAPDPPAYDSIVSFYHEVHMDGVKYPPGQYRIKRIGEAPPCEHDWVDIRNSVVESGAMCKKCSKLRAENVDPVACSHDWVQRQDLVTKRSYAKCRKCYRIDV